MRRNARVTVDAAERRLSLALLAAAMGLTAIIALLGSGELPAPAGLFVLLTVGFMVAQLFPIAVHAGRDTFLFPGGELFFAMGLMVLASPQVVAAAVVGWFAGGLLQGRGPFAAHGLVLPPRRLAGQVASAGIASSLGLLTSMVLGRHGSLTAIVVPVLVYAMIQAVTSPAATQALLRDVPEGRRQLRACLRPMVVATTPLVAAGVLVGVLVRGSPPDLLLLSLGVTGLYVVVARLLLSTTLRRDAYAALIEVASVHEEMRVADVIAAIEDTARRLLHRDRVVVSEWPEEHCAGQVSLGVIAGHPHWLVASPGDQSSRLHPSQVRLLQELAAVSATALRNVMLRAELQRQASRDLLTGLLNRRALYERFESLLAAAQRSGDLLALLYLDLDHFKLVNDRHGHDAGDRVLIEVAERLRECVRSSDVVARIGGDEFVIIATGLKTSVEVNGAAQRITSEFGRPLASDPTGGVGCSVGTAVLGRHGSTLDALLQHADQQMYAAKPDGRGRPRKARAAAH